MEFYRIQIAADASFSNPDNEAVDVDVQLSDMMLLGIAAAAVSEFSDNYQGLIAISDQGGRLVDLNALLAQEGAIVDDGEAAHQLVPEFDRRGKEKPWLQTVQSYLNMYPPTYGSTNTHKVYKLLTVKAGGEDGTHLFQFDNRDFLAGAVALYNALGVNPEEALVFLHHENQPLTLDEYFEGEVEEQVL
jgi:hypothetical protein